MQQPLLRQDAIPEEQVPANDDYFAANDPEFGDGDGGGDTDFTIDSDQIESAIKEQLDNDQKTALNRILEAGNQLLFSKDTHYEVMEGLTDDDDTRLADELGKGGISLAMLLFEKSGGTMPQELIIPAGVVLLARVSEFLKQTGHKINDEIFSKAVEMFHLGFMQKINPEFHKRVMELMAQGMDTMQAMEAVVNEVRPNGNSTISQQPQPEPAMTQQPAGLLGSA